MRRRPAAVLALTLAGILSIFAGALWWEAAHHGGALQAQSAAFWIESADFPALSEHAGSLDYPNKRVIVFGGLDYSRGGGASNTLFIGDSERASYNLEWRSLDATGQVNPPAPRYGHSVHIDREKPLLYVLGGRDSEGLLEMELNVLQLSPTLASVEWIQVPLEGIPPRYDHVSLQHPNSGKLYVFGGRDDCRLYSDLWVIEILGPAEHAIVSRFALESGPKPRYGHTGVLFWGGGTGKRGTIAFYGGATEDSVTDELWLLQLDDAGEPVEWLYVSAANSPGPRFQHGAASSLGFMYVLGGISDTGELASRENLHAIAIGDILRFGPESATWVTQPTIGGPPAARFGAAAIETWQVRPGWMFLESGGLNWSDSGVNQAVNPAWAFVEGSWSAPRGTVTATPTRPPAAGPVVTATQDPCFGHLIAAPTITVSPVASPAPEPLFIPLTHARGLLE